jgi:hypothetical protein
MRWDPNGERVLPKGILSVKEVAGASAETFSSDADPRC